MSKRFEIVVGVNGSGSSLHAVKWAAAEAESRGGTLRLVHAWMWPLAGELRRIPGVTEHAVDALRLLEVASLVATTVYPGVELHTDLVTGSPDLVLSDASREADLLVLGDRGAAGFTGAPVGSVAAAMAEHAACPVLIVRGRLTRSGPVLVAIDGSTADVSVLATAFARAERLATSLLVLHTWDAPARNGGTNRPDHAEHLAMEATMAPLHAACPDVTVDYQATDGSLSDAVVVAAERARVIVIGSEQAGSVLRGLLAASVNSGESSIGRCPVEVVRDTLATRPLALASNAS